MNKHIQRKKKTLDHINRIQGQIERLKKYIEEDKPCNDIAMLTTSIAKSFDTLRARTLEGFVLNELIGDKKVSQQKMKDLEELIYLFKK